jgi:hypothetical protein
MTYPLFGELFSKVKVGWLSFQCGIWVNRQLGFVNLKKQNIRTARKLGWGQERVELVFFVPMKLFKTPVFLLII